MFCRTGRSQSWIEANSTPYERAEAIKWRELELEKRDKADHRMAFGLSIIETMVHRIVGSNGMQPPEPSDSEAFYVKYEKPDDKSHIKQMFETIKALAEAQNARNN